MSSIVSPSAVEEVRGSLIVEARSLGFSVERARRLYLRCRKLGNGIWVSRVQLPSGGYRERCVPNGMTAEEDDLIRRMWDTISGSSTYWEAFFLFTK